MRHRKVSHFFLYGSVDFISSNCFALGKTSMLVFSFDYQAVSNRPDSNYLLAFCICGKRVVICVLLVLLVWLAVR